MKCLHESCSRRVREEQRNIRRSHLLLATVTLFVFCWLPLNILNLAEDLNMPLTTWRWQWMKINNFSHSHLFRFYYFSFFCFHLIAMSSSICNMLLYGWLNENISSQSHIWRNIKVFFSCFSPEVLMYWFVEQTFVAEAYCEYSRDY